MKIYFVRHGHPDYSKNCLTELGHKQAAAAALSLKSSGIEQIFASSYGRAIETAEHTADILLNAPLGMLFLLPQSGGLFFQL